MPKVTGMVAANGNVLVFVSLSSVGSHVLSASGQAIGSFEMVGISLDEGFADFRRGSEVYRIWMDDGKVRTLSKTEPNTPASGRAHGLSDMKNVVVTDDMQNTEFWKKLSGAGLDHLFDGTKLPAEMRQHLLEDLRAGKSKLFVVGEAGVSSKDLAAGAFTPEEAERISRYAKMGEAFRAAPSSKQ